MSDSENDLLPSNVFTFQNENTIISAKGPSINNTTNSSFRNNVLTSTMHMPRNFDRQRYGEPSFDQRSMYHFRRETSPASMYSGSGPRARNFHQSYYGGGMSSQRSMYYGRGGSPMSMRSMDSNASVSAADIALAFKNENFNKHDLRMIKDAYNKFMKRRIRKKIEKRRNMRLFLKGYRRKSGYDSGEQGSDSSISSDGCKSTSSAMYKDNMSCRSTRTDISDFRRTIQQSNMYKDCSDNFKQNAFKNMFSVPNSREKFNPPNAVQNVSILPPKQFAVPNTVQKQTFTQKDRFNSGYLLPSQRFNRSVASVPILERDPRLQARQHTWNAEKPTNNEVPRPNGRVNGETDSDQEEIFSEITVREKSMQQNVESQYDIITDKGKRALEIEDSIRCSDRKRPKLSSPIKKTNKADLLKEPCNNAGMINKKKTSDNKNPNGKSTKATEERPKDHSKTQCETSKKPDEFEFLKPQFPVRKSAPAKAKEKLISKSAQPLSDTLPLCNLQPEVVSVALSQTNAPVTEPIVTEDQPDMTQLSNSDLSQRPSFIKRKLFTQKMDVTESKNLSNGALNVNSPQNNVYSAIQKEKHKARKLVTNQSCLSRDIAQEGNPLLDLIHKIVPPDRMNMTNVTNKTSISNSISSKNPVNDDDKWDVTSVISTCNNDDVSDTFTDEDIFSVGETNRKVDDKAKNKTPVKSVKENDKIKKTSVQKQNVNKKTKTNISKPNVCRILVEKLPQNKLPTNLPVEISKTVTVPEIDNNKRSVYSCVKSFWDTDFESDMEGPTPKRPLRTEAVRENLKRSLENDLDSPALKRPLLRSEAVKENQDKSNFMNEYKIPKTNRNPNISLATVSESIKSRTMPTNNLGKIRTFNISKTLTIKSYFTPKQLKGNQNRAKGSQESREIPKRIDTPEPSHKEPVKKLVKQNTAETVNKSVKQNKVEPVKRSGKQNTVEPVKKSAKNNTVKKVETEPKKPETKKTNRKRSGDLLDTTVETNKTTKPQPKTKAKTAKSQSKKQKNESNASINNSVTRTLRTPKRNACCDESYNNNLNRTTRSSATKQKEKVKRTPTQKTNSKANNAKTGTMKDEAKKLGRKNGDHLNTSSITTRSQPKSTVKAAKAQNAKSNNKVANKSMTRSRTAGTPKRKA